MKFIRLWSNYTSFMQLELSVSSWLLPVCIADDKGRSMNIQPIPLEISDLGNLSWPCTANSELKKILALFIEWQIFRAYFFRQDQHRPIPFACTEQVDFAHKPTIGRNSSTINFKSFWSTRDVIKVTLKLIKDSVDSDSLYFQTT